MTNEEKAEELRKTALPNPLPDGYGMWLCASDVDAILIKMAKWKEQQMIDKACEWLKEYGGVYWMDDYDLPTDELVNDFKKAMKGEEE